MPPKPKVTRQMILDATFGLVREKGVESLSVRAVAEVLGCSTQPIMYNFKTVEELRDAVYQVADDFHTRFIAPSGDEAQNPLLELGLNYIRFGAQEPHLFRFLFQTAKFAGHSLDDLMDDPGIDGMLGLVQQAAGCSKSRAREAFSLLFVVAHGMASLLANNAMVYDEQECTRILLMAHASAMAGEE